MSRPEDSATDGSRVLEGREAYAGATGELLTSGRREVRILSFNLDQRLYGGSSVYAAAKDFLLISQHSRLKILLNETRHAAQGHRLVELGRRLSSFVEFRVLSEKNREIVSDWVIIDERSLLIRRRPEALEARLWEDAASRARQQRAQFDALWDQAEPASEFRTLGVG